MELYTDNELIFNFFTIPAWVSALVSIIAFGVFFVFFEDADLPKKTCNSRGELFSFFRSKFLLFHAGALGFIQLVGTFAITR